MLDHQQHQLLFSILCWQCPLAKYESAVDTTQRFPYHNKKKIGSICTLCVWNPIKVNPTSLLLKITLCSSCWIHRGVLAVLVMLQLGGLKKLFQFEEVLNSFSHCFCSLLFYAIATLNKKLFESTHQLWISFVLFFLSGEALWPHFLLLSPKK